VKEALFLQAKRYDDRFCKIACIGEAKRGQFFAEEKKEKEFHYKFLKYS